MSPMRALGAPLLVSFVVSVAQPSSSAPKAPPKAPAPQVKGAPKRGVAPPKKPQTTRKKRRHSGSVGGAEEHHTPSLPLLHATIRCPDDMVAVAGRVCVDRYEASLVELETHEPLSPYYPPSPKLFAWSLEHWATARDQEPEGTLARTMPLPPVPALQAGPSWSFKAMSWPHATPSGYVTGEQAKLACERSQKRLCSEAEWVTACRGQRQTRFPYGTRFDAGACNVFREDHPAHVLHGSFSIGLTDPRLNQITVDDRPLLRDTGKTPACASVWGDDAIYDMVGNLDEWVDDADGTFVGGFYARATRSGCDARVRNHPSSYFDYSTGVRCCRDPG